VEGSLFSITVVGSNQGECFVSIFFFFQIFLKISELLRIWEVICFWYSW